MTEIDELIKKHFKTTDVACLRLGVTKAAISQWRTGGIPELRRHQIENITRKKRAKRT